MIRLRPLLGAEVSDLDDAMNDPERAGTYNWFGHRPSRLTQRSERNELITDDAGILAIEAGGEFAGTMSWHARDNGPRPNGRCWMIGSFVLPEHRGRGVGTAAHHAIVRYLFSHTPAVRIEAGTEVENAAERRVLERVGFVHEGTLRKAVFRDGDWRDMAVYGMLRSDVGI
jgi:RimJ/RimL family protein N-acetyltransferase